MREDGDKARSLGKIIRDPQAARKRGVEAFEQRRKKAIERERGRQPHWHPGEIPTRRTCAIEDGLMIAADADVITHQARPHIARRARKFSAWLEWRPRSGRGPEKDPHGLIQAYVAFEVVLSAIGRSPKPIGEWRGLSAAVSRAQQLLFDADRNDQAIRRSASRNLPTLIEYRKNRNK
ncbi:MAG TPA: hypothetical protein EYO33_06745 [Phycisphaerales bacterium]|nr:hypothetical protein [Phycisphaerales bacterium]